MNIADHREEVTWKGKLSKKVIVLFTGKFTRLGQQIFPGVVFEIIFHPWIFIIMV